MNNSSSATLALILIAVALAGAGISYHFTLESRFAAIEQKLDQNSSALQEYQASQENIFASKNDALVNLNKEVDALQSSLQPLGKATHEQTDSLAEIHKQIASLQQAQQAEQDTQKKLADYAAQLEKVKHDIQAQSAQTQAPPPAPTSSAAPLPSAHASATVALPLTPRVETNVDLRPAETNMTDNADLSVRALPVALPATLSVSDAR
jgi:chromosome segregation ATPase